MKSHELEKVFHHFKYFTLWGMTPPNWFPHFQVQSVLPKSKNHVLWSLPTKPGTCPTPLERRAPRRLPEPLKKFSAQLSMLVPQGRAHLLLVPPMTSHISTSNVSDALTSLYTNITTKKRKPFLTDCLFWRALCIRWHLSHQSNNEGLRCRVRKAQSPLKRKKSPLPFQAPAGTCWLLVPKW